MNEAVFAVDLGGTNIRLAAVTREGEVLQSVRKKTPDGIEPEGLISTITAMVAECRENLGTIRASAIGIGVPANVTADGVLRHLPNLPTLDGFNLKTAAADALGLKVAVENDATAACIGESWLGATNGSRTSILVTLGTGVGGGVIVDGEVLRGPDGGAGKIGHISVEPDGHKCGCGSNGCLEQYASGKALVRIAAETGLDVPHSLALYKAYEAGDRTAASVFDRMGRYLGIALGGLVNTLNPDIIVIGGGVAAGFDAFVSPLLGELRYRAFEEPAERAKVVRSLLGDRAGIFGAARSAFGTIREDFACVEGAS